MGLSRRSTSLDRFRREIPWSCSRGRPRTSAATTKDQVQIASGERGSSSLTSTAMRLPLTITVPFATGMLLARMRTSSSSDESSSMMAPRPRRRTWWIGIDVVPSTTAISIETLSSVAKGPPTRLLSVELRYDKLWAGYGYEVVNTRGDLTIGLLPPADSAPVEWRVTDGVVDYDAALAAMTARAAAIS